MSSLNYISSVTGKNQNFFSTNRSMYPDRNSLQGVVMGDVSGTREPAIAGSETLQCANRNFGFMNVNKLY